MATDVLECAELPMPHGPEVVPQVLKDAVRRSVMSVLESSAYAMRGTNAFQHTLEWWLR